MAVEFPGKVVTSPAGADLSTSQFRFVTINGNGQAVIASTGAPVFGVLQNKPKLGQAASIMVDGISKMVAPASTLSAGDLVAVGANGQPAPLAAGNYAVGRVVRGSSGGAGRILSVSIEPIGTT